MFARRITITYSAFLLRRYPYSIQVKVLYPGRRRCGLGLCFLVLSDWFFNDGRTDATPCPVSYLRRRHQPVGHSPIGQSPRR